MFGRRTSSRTPGSRATVILFAALALAAILFGYLGGAVAGAAPAAQGTPEPADTTPTLESTPVAAGQGELPPDAAAALEAYLAAGASVASLDEADMPIGLFSSFTYVHLPMLVEGTGTGTGPTPTPPTETPEPDPADVSVRLWSDPSIRVIRGGTFVYEVRVRNHGSASASQIRVSLPNRRDQYTLVDAQLDRSRGDWVTNRDGNTIDITFGRLAPNTERTGRLIFRAASTLANDTVLDMRATYGWDDSASGGRNMRSNWQPLLVGAGNASAPWVWTTIGPNSGPATAVFRVQSNRFTPGETVVTWLNTPRGVQELDLSDTADGLGVVDMYFQDTRLPRGDYQIVLHGLRSGLTGIASFSIR